MKVEAVAVERCPMGRTKVVPKLPGELVIRNASLNEDAPTGRVRCTSRLEVPLRDVA